MKKTKKTKKTKNQNFLKYFPSDEELSFVFGPGVKIPLTNSQLDRYAEMDKRVETDPEYAAAVHEAENAMIELFLHSSTDTSKERFSQAIGKLMELN